MTMADTSSGYRNAIVPELENNICLSVVTMSWTLIHVKKRFANISQEYLHAYKLE